MNEMPSISASTYTSSAVQPALMGAVAFDGPKPRADQWTPAEIDKALAGDMQARRHQQLNQLNQLMKAAGVTGEPTSTAGTKPTMSTARIVKVFIADPNENLPLDKRVIYSGDEKLTDSTDQELFFEVPISELLAKQNAVRATTVDKKLSEKAGREIFLEPARIRDLKMVVVTIAQF